MATESAKVSEELKKTEAKSQQKQTATEESEEIETTVKVTQPIKRIQTSVETQRRFLPDGKVEETKITTTNTIVNDKIIDSKVNKESRILSDEEAKEVIEEGSEEEEEVIEEEQENTDKKLTNVKQNGHQQVNISASHTDSKKTSTNVTQETTQTTKTSTGSSKQVVEEVETVGEEQVKESSGKKQGKENVQTTTVVVKEDTSKKTNADDEQEEVEEEEEIEEEEIEEEEETEVTEKTETQSKTNSSKTVTANTTSVEVTTHQTESSKRVQSEKTVEKESENVLEITSYEPEDEEEAEEEEVEEEEVVEEKVETKTANKTKDNSQSVATIQASEPKNEEKVVHEVKETTSQKTTVQPEDQSVEIHVQKSVTDKQTVQKKTSFSETDHETSTPSSAPETQTTTKTETTEILSSDIPIDQPMSTQTEIRRLENIITEIKTSKILDNSYEQLTQQGVPTVKTYFPPTREKIPPISPPAKPYTPTFPINSERKEERRHSLLLERLSTERQFAAPESYHNTYSNQSNEYNNNQWNQEPQSEVVIASNVKPSSVKTNSQWYQNSQQTQYSQQNSNAIYNNVSPSTPLNNSNQTPQPSWSQPTYETAPSASLNQPSVNQGYSTPKPSWTQPSYDNYAAPPQAPVNNVHTPSQPSWSQPTYDNSSYSVPTYQQPEQSSYSPAPKQNSWGSNNLGNLDRIPSINAQSNQYSFLTNQKSTESYSNQYNTQSQYASGTDQYNQARETKESSIGTNKYSSGYVPPPWETEGNSYQPSPFYEPKSAPVTSSTAPPLWKSPAPTPAPKKGPLAYIPPAPNASFVKQASPAPKPPAGPGRKTYYSEYERRYISVPESTYVPPETKLQPQWDASPQYYYDNAEPAEQIEPPWRKELREFTEKSTKEETSVVQPPWANETKYSKETTTNFSNPPSWSQTLRPRSWRETSYESESFHQSQEWPRSETKRPVSAYVRNRVDSSKIERTRGVSVDRYNSSSYQSPNTFQTSSVTPSQSNNYTFSWETQEQTTTNDNNGTQTITSGAKGYHNPQVPAYHTRSNEARDYQVSYTPRWSGQGRERPVQSRSFMYLQMLTGTEDGEEEPEPFVVQQPHHAVPKPRRV